MKKIFIIYFFLLFGLKLTAQFTTPLPDTSASWTILVDYYDSNPPSPGFVYYHNRTVLVKDTLIDTLTYFKIGYTDNLIDTIFDFSYLYRIDSMKVYFREPNGIEKLKYDFGMQVGDSMEVYQGDGYAVLESIDTVIIASGQELTRYNLSCLTCFYFSDNIWYYGIGSFHGPFPWQSPFSVISSFYYKNECYIFDSALGYDSTICASANLLGVNETQKIELNIYPNPSTGMFKVEIPDYKNSKLKIFDINGREILAIDLTSEIAEINLNENPGVYFMRIENEKAVYTQRILIID